VNRVQFLNRYHHETSSVDYLQVYKKLYYKFLKFVYLIMQIMHYLIKYEQFCIYLIRQIRHYLIKYEQFCIYFR